MNIKSINYDFNYDIQKFLNNKFQKIISKEIWSLKAKYLLNKFPELQRGFNQYFGTHKK